MEKIDFPSTAINNIYLYIEDLSNINKLTADWLGSKNNFLNYSEFIAGLYDDFWFDLFVKNQIKLLGFSSELDKWLNKLNDSLINYDKKVEKEKLSDKEILTDKTFIGIIQEAIKVKSLWEADKLAKQYINLD